MASSMSSAAGSAKRKRVVAAEMLECPVCYKLMGGKINQCEQGHALCGRCCKKMETCPSCRCSMNPSKPIRCLALEQVAETVEVPCEHEGCRASVSVKELKKHMADCEYRPYLCPTCEEEVPGPKLWQHVREKHDEDIISRKGKLWLLELERTVDREERYWESWDPYYIEVPGTGGKELLVLDVSVGHKGMDYDGLTDYVKDARGCLNVCVRQLVKRSQPRMVTVHLLDGNRTALPGRGERCRRVMQSFEAQSLRRGLQDIVDERDCMSVGVDLLKKMMYKVEGADDNMRSFNIAVEVD